MGVNEESDVKFCKRKFKCHYLEHGVSKDKDIVELSDFCFSFLRSHKEKGFGAHLTSTSGTGSSILRDLHNVNRSETSAFA